MKSQLRVCHIYSRLVPGGAERQFVHLVNNLKTEYTCAIFLTKGATGWFYELLDKNVETFFIPIRVRTSPYYILKLAQLLKNKRIDVLHTHTYWPNLYGGVAGSIAKTPVIVTTQHGRDIWKKKYQCVIEQKIISKNADKRVCVSEDILNLMKNREKIPEEKLIHISNGIVIPNFKKNYNSLNKEKVVICTIGRFVVEKDYATLLKACFLLKKKGIDFHLNIVGDGPLRKDLELLISQLDISDVVSIPGFQANVDEWLMKTDIFVMSSISEGQPMVLLEAMAYGLPIVATTVGGIPSTLRNFEEGLLVPPGSPESLCDAIVTFTSDDKTRIKCGTNARKRLEKEFSIENICRQYMNLYEKIYSQNK